MQIGVDSQRAVETRRIYVVDDDEITRTALQFMLHDENESHEFATLAAALEQAVSRPPDVLLLGAALLAGAGARLPLELKAGLPATKLLAVCDVPGQTAHVPGLDGVIVKPLRLESVRGGVDAVLGRTAATAIGKRDAV